LSDVLQKFWDRLTDNFNKHPNSNVSKLLKIAAAHIQENTDLLDKIEEWRDVDKAEGAVLDRHGRNVRQERGQATDEVFRVLIKSKVLRNFSNGSIDTIIEFLAFILQVDPQVVKVRELWPDDDWLLRNNLLGTDGNFEATNTMAYGGGTAALDSTRKTTGANSVKITKTSTATNVDPLAAKRIYPAVGDCYLAIADVYNENAATNVYMTSLSTGVTRTAKVVTSNVTGSYAATTVGIFVPVVYAFKVTAVTTPGVSYIYPRIQHTGTSGHAFNVDSFRIFKITQAEFDSFVTASSLEVCKEIANKYRYVDANVVASTPGRWAALHVDVPAGEIAKTGLSLNQFGRLVNAVTAHGVRAEVLFAGTFAFSSNYTQEEIDPATGFASVDGTQGGTLGYTYDPEHDVELPI